jgi:hypothetical protein
MGSKKGMAASLSPIMKFIIGAIVVLGAASFLFTDDIKNWVNGYTGDQIELLEAQNRNNTNYYDVIMTEPEIVALRSHVYTFMNDVETASKDRVCVIKLSEPFVKSWSQEGLTDDATFKLFYNTVLGVGNKPINKIYVSLDVKQQRQTQNIHEPLEGITTVSILDDIAQKPYAELVKNIESFEKSSQNTGVVRYLEHKNSRGIIGIYKTGRSYKDEVFVYFSGVLKPFIPYKDGQGDLRILSGDSGKDEASVRDFSKEYVLRSGSNLYFFEHRGFVPPESALC